MGSPARGCGEEGRAPSGVVSGRLDGGSAAETVETHLEFLSLEPEFTS